MVREAARNYCQQKLASWRPFAKNDAAFREMGELGLLGPTIPTEYGGPGSSYVSYGLIAREVERVDSGYRSMMSVQSSLVMLPIHEFGNSATKRKYLPKLASGRADRLLRPHRAQPRLGPGLDADARQGR